MFPLTVLLTDLCHRFEDSVTDPLSLVVVVETNSHRRTNVSGGSCNLDKQITDETSVKSTLFLCPPRSLATIR